VPAGSPRAVIDDVDRPGIQIAVSDRSAYDLYLTRALKHAELQRARGLGGAVDLFTSSKLDALAGLRPALIEDIKSMPGARILDGNYTTVQQAIGTPPKNVAAAAFLQDFVMEARASGLVAGFIERHGVEGRLLVASGD